MASINLQDGEQARLTITKEQEAEISKLYHKVYLNLKKQMDALPLQGEGTTSQSLKKTYLNKLIKQLKAEYKSLGEGLEKQIKKGMKDVSSSVVQANDDWLQKVGIKIEGAYSFVPSDIVALVSTGKLYGGGWTLSKAIWGESQKHAHDIDTIVASGIAANRSAYDIAKDLEKYVNPSAKKEWDWSKVYPGTSKKVDYNAQRLARTMVSHAYQQSLLATTKYNPFVKGYRWRSAHSDRTCELCNERDGQLYSSNDLPLDHPNGMCTFIAELTGDLESIADRLGDWANGADDPALDEWAKSMYPSKKEYQFTKLQQEWLGAAGFSPTNMPQNFKSFANGLTFDKQTELLKLAGTDWNNPHPYQAMEKWYKSNLLGPFSPSGKYSPKTSVKEAVKGTTKKTTKEAPFSTGHNLTTSYINKLLNSQSTDVFEEQAKSWWGGLSKSQRSGISSYTGASYRWMNKALRNGTVDQLTERQQGIIRATQEAVLHHSSNQDMVVRRGSSLRTIFFMCGVEEQDSSWLRDNAKSLVGSVAKDAGFLSSSPVSEGGFHREVEYRIFVPKGSPAPYVDKYSQHRGEKETLLPAGSLSRILDIENNGGQWVVYMEFLGVKK